MAGHFELVTDHQFHLRFQLLAPDGGVLAVSGPFDDKRAAAAAITELRDCANWPDQGPLPKVHDHGPTETGYGCGTGGPHAEQRKTRGFRGKPQCRRREHD